MTVKMTVKLLLCNYRKGKTNLFRRREAETEERIMKTKFRHKIVAMTLAMMMSASPVWGAAFASDEAPAVESQATVTQEVKEEKVAPAQVEEKVVEDKKVEEKVEAAPAVSEEAKAPAEEKAVAEAPAEEAEMVMQAQSAPEEPAVVEEEDAPVVVLDQPASTKLTLHVSNILYAVKKKVNGKAVPYDEVLTISNGSSKGGNGFYNLVGGKTVSPASTADGEYTFLQVFALSKPGSGIITANSADEVRAVTRVGFKNGTATVTFADGSTKQIVNASNVYISPVYKAKLNKHLKFSHIDGVSTGSGSAENLGAAATYTNTFNQPEAQPHYSFLYWKNMEDGNTYQKGDKLSYVLADLPEIYNEVEIYAVWQPSVTVAYHYNGETVETENFEGINVYDKSVEIDGVQYNAWYDEEGNMLAEDAAYAAPEVVTEKVDRTIYNVYARRPVTIEAASAEWTFDGQEHGDDEVAVTDGGLFEGDEIVAEVNSKIASVGETANVIDSVKIMRDGKDVSEYYDITTVDGSLSIKAAPVVAAGTDDSTPAAPEKKAATAKKAGKAAVTNAAAATTEIADEQTPMAAVPATITDSQSPRAANGSWALLNLIMTIITGIISAVLLVGIFGKNEEENEEGEEVEINRKRLARLMSLIPAIGAAIIFILTEDMSNPMVLVDGWTILMAVILLIQAVVAMIAKKSKDENEDDEMATINA